MEKPWVVQEWEYERGWGAKIIGDVDFATYEEAEAYIKKFNSGNTAEVVPDWYMVAKGPYRKK